jgi:hypothetical protein
MGMMSFGEVVFGSWSLPGEPPLELLHPLVDVGPSSLLRGELLDDAGLLDLEPLHLPRGPSGHDLEHRELSLDLSAFVFRKSSRI